MAQMNMHQHMKDAQTHGTSKIHIKPSKEGSLHTAMHVKQGEKISAGAEAKKLAAAKRDGNTSLEKKLVFAMNARRWQH